MKHLIVNAQLLTFSGPSAPRVGVEMGSVGLVRDGAVLIIDELIASAGLRDIVAMHPDAHKARIIDAGGKVVMPGFIDSHTHPVFAAPNFKPPEEALLSIVSGVRSAKEADLTARFFRQAERFLEYGTTTIEAKSGYGLEVDAELKMLRVMKHVAAGTSLEILPTFLGAQAVSPEYKNRPLGYVKVLCEQAIPAVAKEGLARFVDVVCEEGRFNTAEAEIILRAGLSAGLKIRMHADRISSDGGAALAARLKAESADHLDFVSDEDLAKLKAAGTIAVLTPGSHPQSALARRIIGSGVPVALATDFNPVTSPCWNMAEIISLAVSKMGMSPEEALTAATINGAHALGLGKTHGSLEPGKFADLLVMDCEDYREIPYWFGANMVATVIKKGRVVHYFRDFRI